MLFFRYPDSHQQHKCNCTTKRVEERKMLGGENSELTDEITKTPPIKEGKGESIDTKLFTTYAVNKTTAIHISTGETKDTV